MQRQGSGGKRRVWVLEADGVKSTPVQRTIRVGVSDGNATEILPDAEGNLALKAGDDVIVGVQAPGSKNSSSANRAPKMF
jgi:HlyD family secretion protein